MDGETANSFANGSGWRRWLTAGSLRQGRLLRWSCFIVALLFALPVGTVLLSLGRPFGETWSHLAETVLPDYLLNSVALVLIVGIAVPIIGTATAWLVTFCRFPGRAIFVWALVLPLAMPAYVMAYAYTDFLQFSGPLQSQLREMTGWRYGDYWFPEIRSLGGAAALMGLVLYPYVYLLARASFLEQSASALEVARTLGSTAWQAFFRVALPLARPAIVGGTALALMEVLADYGTVSFFGVPTFTTGIVRAWISFGDQAAAAQLASGLLGVVFFVILLERWSRGKARYHHATGRQQSLSGYRLTGYRALVATLVCALPLIFGFLLPVGTLIGLGLAQWSEGLEARLAIIAGDSLILSSVTAVLAVLLALLLGYGARLDPRGPTSLAVRLAAMGYAVPGIVVAIGVLIPFAAFDNALDAALRDSFGFSSGLLLTGSIAALVFAYLVRFLAVALNSVEASLSKIRPSMDDAARALGCGPLSTLKRIHAPIVWSSLLTAGLLVFVDVMKELPATLVMRPFDFDTLAVRAHNLASDERLAEAAVPALAIVIAGLPAVLLLSRAIGSKRGDSSEKLA